MRKTTTTKKTDSDEIVFRVSFDNIDDSDDFIVTKDGKYHFVRTKSLKNDKTKCEIFVKFCIFLFTFFDNLYTIHSD